MSTKLIILLLGAILTLLGVFGAREKNGKKMLNTGLAVALGVVGVCMMIFGSYSSEMMNTTGGRMEQLTVESVKKIDGPVTSTQVISPIDGEKVSCRMLTKGVYPEGNESDIWVLLKPTDKKYYPQADQTNTSFKMNGEWQVITRFGGDKDEPYELIVFEADAAASEFFSKTIEDWNEDGDYVGLTDDQLPAGAKEVDRITISLEHNCRGVF